jgi:hypothetical protein
MVFSPLYCHVPVCPAGVVATLAPRVMPQVLRAAAKTLT